MINFKRKIQEFFESGYLETQLMVEEDLLNDLKTKLLHIDPKDHLQFVSVRGMIEGIQRLQTRRQGFLDN